MPAAGRWQLQLGAGRQPRCPSAAWTGVQAAPTGLVRGLLEATRGALASLWHDEERFLCAVDAGEEGLDPEEPAGKEGLCEGTR